MRACVWCVCVCVRACMRARVRACVRAFMRACVCACVHACVRACVRHVNCLKVRCVPRTYVKRCVLFDERAGDIALLTSRCMNTLMYLAHTYTRIRTHAHAHARTHTHLHALDNEKTHTHTHTHTRTHTHTHTNTHRRSNSRPKRSKRTIKTQITNCQLNRQTPRPPTARRTKTPRRSVALSEQPSNLTQT